MRNQPITGIAAQYLYHKFEQTNVKDVTVCKVVKHKNRPYYHNRWLHSFSNSKRERERERRKEKARVTEVLDSSILLNAQGHFKMMMMMRKRGERDWVRERGIEGENEGERGGRERERGGEGLGRETGKKTGTNQKVQKNIICVSLNYNSTYWQNSLLSELGKKWRLRIQVISWAMQLEADRRSHSAATLTSLASTPPPESQHRKQTSQSTESKPASQQKVNQLLNRK